MIFISLDIDDCAGQTCSSNGNCLDLNDGYECNCTDGFAGINCETGWHLALLFFHNIHIVLCED